MQYSDDLIGQRQRRLDSVKKLRELGVDPYPSRAKKDLPNADITTHFDHHTGKHVSLTGRLTRKRDHGKLMFGDIQDQSGKVQICIRKDMLEGNLKNSELEWEHLDLIDIGDFIQVFGKVDKTTAGEITVFVTQLKLLGKTIRPLPNTLEDKEDRFRRRYLDMTIHPEVRQRFERRSKFWQATRNFLNSQNFVEVNIPVLEHVTGGADARPFVTYYDALNQNFYLRISHELPLKRLIGGGFDKVYDIGPRFRNEGFSDEHLPEHVAMEWYWAYADYKEGMKLSQDMYKYVMKEVYGKLQFKIREYDVDLDKDEWPELKFAEAIQKHFKVDIFTDSVESMNAVLKKNGVDLGDETNRNRVVDNLWKLVRKTIAGPVFLTGTPKFLSPLAKSNPENPNIVDRFQIIIAGSELGNAWSELNDPVDQLDRFLEQQNMRESGDEEAQMLDIDYVEMLEYGMPPAVGFGFSERVFWFFENVTAREGVPFPQLKSEIEENTKKIYDLDHMQSKHMTDPAVEKPQDFSKKIVVVVNENLEDWQIANALGHVSAYLGNKLRQDFGTGANFYTKDSKAHPRNSQYPIIILGADEAKLKSFIGKVRESGLVFHGFFREMIETSNDQEIVTILKDKSDAELEYLAIGVFGPNEEVDKLTNKFKLFKSNAAPKSSVPSKSDDNSTPSDNIDYSVLYPKAVELLKEHIKNENLQRHCYDVEKAMRFYAKKLGEDEHKWAVTGLLHDIDWEIKPDTHPKTAVPILEELGVGQDVINAVLGHAYPALTDTPRETQLDHYLFACDEITGFINAYSRMKTDGLASVEAKSVVKKMKDKGFARNVSREDMVLGAQEISTDLEKHVENVIEAMRT